MGSAIITIKQLVIMFFFMGMGFFFAKKKILDQSAGGTLSKIVVNLFLPAMAFRVFATGFTTDVVTEKLKIILFSCAVLGVTTVLAIFLSRILAKNRLTRDIYIYSFAIPNLGMMAYPLVQGLFPEKFLDTQVFCIVYNIFIYTAGIYLLTPNKKLTFKALLNPSLVAVFLGMIVGLLAVKIPGPVDKILVACNNCVMPVAMILTGTVFARIDIKAVLSDWHSYVTAAIRLLAIPLISLLVFRLFNLPEEWIFPAVVVLAMPCGVNSVVFPEAYGGDAVSGAKICFMSAILALVTIPLVISLL